MRTLKIAAHFILTPEGELRRWPVLTLKPNGCVQGVRVQPQGLKEEPALRFHGGILVPGFIDVVLTPRYYSPDRHFARGTLIVAMESPTSELIRRASPPYVVDRPQEALNELPLAPSLEGHPLWERMKEVALQNRTLPLDQTLCQATSHAAKMLQIKGAGSFLKGSFPGVLLIEGADLHKMQLTPQSTVKWLVVPENIFVPDQKHTTN